MSKNAHGTRKRYQEGCDCDPCKGAEAEYKRGLRQRQREAVGEFAAPVVTPLSLVTGGTETVPSVGAARKSAVEAVSAAIESLDARKSPDLEAAALAMAAILDNPKAISTQPAAAKNLAEFMAQLRKAGSGRQSKLATVKSMTSANTKTG